MTDRDISYKDFAVRLAPDAELGYRVDVVDSPHGLASEPFEPMWGASQVAAELAALEGEIAAATRAGADADARARVEQSFRRIGRALYRSLFEGEVGHRFEQGLSAIEELNAGGANTGVRVRLLLEDDPELGHVAALPWELLYRAPQHDFLARIRRTAVVRYLETGRYIPPLAVGRRLRVLLVASEPAGVSPLHVDEEVRRIREALSLATDVDVDIHTYGQPQLSELRHRLLRQRINVLHFMGHGGFEAGEGCLAFAADDGAEVRVTAPMFADSLKDLVDLRLVVLSSCWGAALPRRGGRSAFTSVAPAVVLAGVPAVVAMQFPISNEAAFAFSQTFYRALAHRDPVDAAVAEGRLAVFGTKPVSAEWATPALFLRVGDGQLFAPLAEEAEPPAAPPPEPAASTAPDAPPLKLGIRTGLTSLGQDFAPDMPTEVHRFLPLDEYFDGDRKIRQDELWAAGIFPKLQAFLLAAQETRRPLHIDFAAHHTVAFATGFLLEAKSGVGVKLRQRGIRGPGDWWSQDGSLKTGELWNVGADVAIDPAGADVAIALGVSGTVLSDVRDYVEGTGLSVRRVVPLTIAPEPSPMAVDGGLHALQLAQRVCSLLKERPRPERRGAVHLFVAGPNALLFFLGQLWRQLGAVQLYEYDFGAPPEQRTYRPSLRLPLPDSRY